jgi:group I intron endonuclease
MNDKKWYVYKHTNKINGKIYIGQTSQNPTTRFLSGHGYRKSVHFNSAIKKYGWKNFSHEILESELTREEANEMEKHYIFFYDSTNRKFGYNKRSGGKNFELSEEKKKEYGERMRQINRSHKGVPLSEEHKKKISESRKGKRVGKDHQFYGRVLPPEEMERLRLANIGRPSGVNKHVIQLDLNDNIITEWESAKKAGESLNIDFSTITKCCRKKRKTTGKFKWRYKDE